MIQTNESFPFNLRKLFTIGLVAGLLLAYFEIRGLFSAEQPSSKLLSAIGLVTIGLYILIVAIGVIGFILGLWKSQSLEIPTQKLTFLRWPFSFIMVGFLTWTYLFSPWQAILIAPWTQFIFASSLTCIVTSLFNPKRDYPFGWSELALAFVVFLYPRVVQELRIVYPIPFATHGAIIGGFAFLLILIFLLFEPSGEFLRVKLLDLRIRLAGFRQVFIVLLLLTPLSYRYLIGAGGYILYPNFRFAVCLVAIVVAAYLICIETGHIVTIESMTVSIGWFVLISAITRSLLLVVNDPFSLYWSEGNRFYDYSLMFGQNLYNYSGNIPSSYTSPGRYGLWGVAYLWQGLPIWAHRLWNVFLLTVPSFVLAWALTRKVQVTFLRIILFLWITAFFILQAQLHPPFMIVVIIVVLFAFHPSPYVRGVSLIIASLYAGISRWTWVFAPGAWGALVDLLLYYPKREGSWFKRILPTILMAALGAMPGFLLNIRAFLGYSSGENTTAQQPLLWYRLLPNPTLGPGIVLLTFLTTGPLIVLFLYKLFSRQWKLDRFQLFAVCGSLIGFLGIGLAISTKIGGGGDLHNMDMYIGTLIIILMLIVTVQFQDTDVKFWPSWVLAILCFFVWLPVYQFTPFFPSAANHAWLDIPKQAESEEALLQIRSSVEEASEHGEVLFMDQRQLLTFGYMPAIPFVPEYEKKYMMDQAMASNESYFHPYYQDLARSRFALIVTEPLKEGLKDSGPFSEENDLWVTWVSVPTLCFYEPVMTNKAVGVQLLVPRKDIASCEKYLQ